METYVCPKCGKKTMVKTLTMDRKYTLVCQTCGLERGRLPVDEKRDVF